jgi:hypothetical protein
MKGILLSSPCPSGFRGEDFLSSPLKPLGQMNQNLVGRIYGRFSIKNFHFVLIRYTPRNEVVGEYTGFTMSVRL